MPEAQVVDPIDAALAAARQQIMICYQDFRKVEVQISPKGGGGSPLGDPVKVPASRPDLLTRERFQALMEQSPYGQVLIEPLFQDEDPARVAQAILAAR